MPSPPSSTRELILPLKKLKINRPNLNTLPPEIIARIVSILDRNYNLSSQSNGRRKAFSAYSRICPSFSFYAQEIMWDSLSFGTSGQTLMWLESAATIRGCYRTRYLTFKGSITTTTIEEVLELINQGNYSNGLKSFSLELNGACELSLLLSNKLQGLNVILLHSPVTYILTDTGSFPFQLKCLVLGGNFTGSATLIDQLLTPSLEFFQFYIADVPTVEHINTSLNLATGLNYLDTFSMLLNLSNVPDYPSFHDLKLICDVETTELLTLVSILEVLHPIEPSVKTFGLRLCGEPSVALEEFNLVLQETVMNIIKLPSLRKLEKFKIQHWSLFSEVYQVELITEGKKRGINVVFIV